MWEFTQAATVGEHAALEVPGQVVPQVPAVGDLHRVRGAEPGGLGVGTGPVPADHLDSGVFLQPGGETGHLAVGQQVDRPPAGHVDHDAAVDVAAAQREVVDPEDRNSRDRHVGKTPQQAQQAVSAGRHAQPRPRAGRRRARPAPPRSWTAFVAATTVRRALGAVSAAGCSANVRAAHAALSQKNRRKRSPKPPPGSISANRWAEWVPASIMPSRNLSMPRSKSSGSTAPPIRRGNTPVRMWLVTSSSATIPSDFTQRWATEPHGRPTTSIRINGKRPDNTNSSYPKNAGRPS